MNQKTRVEKLENQQATAPAENTPATWRELINWPDGETLPGWNEFASKAGGTDEPKSAN